MTPATIREVCGFIIGHAHDTEDDVRATIDLGMRLAKLADAVHKSVDER
jgi:hypothetical protein